MVLYICIAGALVVLILLYATLQYSLLVPPTRGLPILMYHNFSTVRADALTMRKDKFESHLRYLRESGYSSIRAKDLIDFQKGAGRLPGKKVMITIDDGYSGTETIAIPLLKKYGFNAILFIPTGAIGGNNLWDGGSESILELESLKKLDPAVIELGFHSHSHCNYKTLSHSELEEDLAASIQFNKNKDLTFTPLLAYPYGGRPKRDSQLYFQMIELFKQQGIKFAFRIGNRVNKIPLKDAFEINRISIRGDDSFWRFKTKLKKGRIKMF